MDFIKKQTNQQQQKNPTQKKQFKTTKQTKKQKPPKNKQTKTPNRQQQDKTPSKIIKPNLFKCCMTFPAVSVHGRKTATSLNCERENKK